MDFKKDALIILLVIIFSFGDGKGINVNSVRLRILGWEVLFLDFWVGLQVIL